MNSGNPENLADPTSNSCNNTNGENDNQTEGVKLLQTSCWSIMTSWILFTNPFYNGGNIQNDFEFEQLDFDVNIDFTTDDSDEENNACEFINYEDNEADPNLKTQIDDVGDSEGQIGDIKRQNCDVRHSQIQSGGGQKADVLCDNMGVKYDVKDNDGQNYDGKNIEGQNDNGRDTEGQNNDARDNKIQDKDRSSEAENNDTDESQESDSDSTNSESDCDSVYMYTLNICIPYITISF